MHVKAERECYTSHALFKRICAVLYAGFAKFRYLQTSNIPESAMKTKNEMFFMDLRELQPILFWKCGVFLLFSMIGIVVYGTKQDTSFENTVGLLFGA